MKNKQFFKNFSKIFANKKVEKQPVLGELWGMFAKEDCDYQGELVDFVIDASVENIFAA